MNDKVNKAWSERSNLFGDDRRAVMEQAFPDAINDYIESIHLEEVKKILNNKKLTALDIGCGYGRIAVLVAKKYPRVFIYGIDIAPHFIKLFNRNLKKRGKGIVGDATKLPFAQKSFDCIWVIVTLMYLENKKEQEKAIKEILRVLRPGGKLIIIEPNKNGVDIVKFWGIAPFIYRTLLRKKKVETFGIAFPGDRVESIVKKSGGILIEKRGYPFFTIGLLPLIALSKIIPPQAAHFVLKLIRTLDKSLSSPSFSYFITYKITKS